MGSIGTPEFIIPTIDISQYLQDSRSPLAQAIVQQIRDACATSGFFSLIGHGIPETLQQQAFAAAKRLFDLPSKEKVKLRDKPGRGYELIGTQTLEKGKKPDLKEVSLSRASNVSMNIA